jgi:hypothetical protein
MCGHGSAFVPQIALLIAVPTRIGLSLSSGRNLEIIPITLGVSSWKVPRQRLRPASCCSLPISRFNDAETLSARKAGQATKTSPHEMVPRS